LGLGIDLKLNTDIAWENIEYKITDIEPEKVTFYVEENEENFVFDFPAFKDFEIRAK